MSRRLTTVFFAMLVLTAAMGLKTVVAAQNDGAAMMANGPAAPPPDRFMNGPAAPPPDRFMNGPAAPPPDRAQ